MSFRTVLALLLLSSGHAYAQRPTPLDSLNVRFMLPGYCFAATSIDDTNALGGFGRSENAAHRLGPTLELPRGQIVMRADPEAAAVFAQRYIGMRLILANTTDTVARFVASDSRLSIIQEALDPDGEWRFIEYLPSSWCGNSYHHVFLRPGEFWSFSAPRYAGTVHTRMRFRLVLWARGLDTSLYSNEFDGTVNPEQFSVVGGHSPSGIMDPYPAFRRPGLLHGLIDSAGRVILPPTYDAVQETEDRIAVLRNGKWGVIDWTGRELISPEYDDIFILENGVSLVNRGATLQLTGVLEGGTWGIAGRDGRVNVPTTYSWVGMVTCGYAVVARDTLRGVVSLDGKEVVPLLFDRVEMLDPERDYSSITRLGCSRGFVVNQDGRYGLYESDRGEVLPVVASKWSVVGNDIFGFLIDGTWWLVRLDGSRRRLPGVTRIGRCSEGLIPVQVDGRWGHIDSSGKTVIRPRFLSAEEFTNGRAAVETQKGRYGYVDTHDSVVIPAAFEAAETFRGESAVVRLAGKYAMINRQGRLITPWLDRIQRSGTDRYEVRMAHGDGLIRSDGSYILQPRYFKIRTGPSGITATDRDTLFVFRSDGTLTNAFHGIDARGWNREDREYQVGWVVTESSGEGWIDSTGRLAVPPRWHTVQSASDCCVVVTDDECYGFVNTDGRVVVPPRYAYVGRFRDGVAVFAITK